MSRPEPRSLLAPHLVAGHHGRPEEPGVRISETRLDAVELSAGRGQTDALREAVRRGLGLELPAMGQVLNSRTLSALGIGPGHWLIVAARREPGALEGRVALAAGAAASVVETGHGLVWLRIGGPAVRDVLAELCRLDLHPSAFGPGRAARTLLGPLPGLIWRRDAEADGTAPVFALAAPASFAQSFAHLVLSAASSRGALVLPPETER